MASIDSSEMMRAVKNAQLFAMKKDGRPALSYARLTYVDDGLEIVATDSYALIKETVPCEVGKNEIGQRGLLPVHDLVAALAEMKVNKTMQLDIKDGEVTVIVGNVNQTFDVTRMVTYPNVENIIPTLSPGVREMHGPLGISGWQLVRVGKVVSSEGGASKGYNQQGSPVRWQAESEFKPMTFDIGSHIQVVVMPIRL